ncbi:MAG: aspartate carbamoyltransferase [Methylococcales bacterium]|nr:aspartate carbamoyltransferase [Methylococcales bacterium]
MKIKYFQTFLILGLCLLSQSANSEYNARQSEVARRGAEVMPFSLAKTLHQFTKTADGGVQKVIARDPTDQEQIVLIRQHLRQLAQKFSVGDYSGPASIHGADMPGLAQLKQASPAQLKIVYADDPAGASLTFTAADSRFIPAVHAWFDAQLHDHGHDAVEMHRLHHPSQP